MTSNEHGADRGPAKILAGDIGGTNSRLAIYQQENRELVKVSQKIYPSGEYGSVTEIIAEFLAKGGTDCDVACLGLPGPVTAGDAVHFFSGGVAPKIMDTVGSCTLLAAPVDKGRMRPLLEQAPVYLVRDDDLALTGAARTALRRAGLAARV